MYINNIVLHIAHNSNAFEYWSASSLVDRKNKSISIEKWQFNYQIDRVLFHLDLTFLCLLNLWFWDGKMLWSWHFILTWHFSVFQSMHGFQMVKCCGVMLKSCGLGGNLVPAVRGWSWTKILAKSRHGENC